MCLSKLYRESCNSRRKGKREVIGDKIAVRIYYSTKHNYTGTVHRFILFIYFLVLYRFLYVKTYKTGFVTHNVLDY